MTSPELKKIELKFSCNLCNSTERNSFGLAALREHIATSHQDINAYSCPKCSKKFMSPHLAYLHIRCECKMMGLMPLNQYATGILAYDALTLQVLYNLEKQAVTNFAAEYAKSAVEEYKKSQATLKRSPVVIKSL